MIIKNEEDYLEGLLAAADDAANDIIIDDVNGFNNEELKAETAKN